MLFSINVNQTLKTGKSDFEVHNASFPFYSGEEVICIDCPEHYKDFLILGKVYEVTLDDTMHLGIKDELWGKLFNARIGFRNPDYFVRKNNLSSLLWGV